MKCKEATKVFVKDPENNIDFIIYNHLFSKDCSYKFTIEQLVEELEQYKLHLTTKCIQEKIDNFVKAGLLNQYFRCYSVCGR